MSDKIVCQFCGIDGIGSWNCYEELSPNRRTTYRFCDNCKSKWVAYAKCRGVKFDEIPNYRDGCSCHYLSDTNKVRQLWQLFIKKKIWTKRIRDFKPEVVQFT